MDEKFKPSGYDRNLHNFKNSKHYNKASIQNKNDMLMTSNKKSGINTNTYTSSEDEDSSSNDFDFKVADSSESNIDLNNTNQPKNKDSVKKEVRFVPPTIKSDHTTHPIQTPPLQTSSLQDPSVQITALQTPPLQNPPLQDSSVQNPSLQDPPLQNPPLQNPPLQDRPRQTPPLQDRPRQMPPLRDPPRQTRNPRNPHVRGRNFQTPPIREKKNIKESNNENGDDGICKVVSLVYIDKKNGFTEKSTEKCLDDVFTKFKGSSNPYARSYSDRRTGKSGNRFQRFKAEVHAVNPPDKNHTHSTDTTKNSKDTSKSKDASKSKDDSKSRDAPKSKDVSKSKDVPKLKDAPKSKDVPKLKDAPKSRDVPKLRDVPKSKDVPKLRDAPKFKDVPKSRDVPKSKDAPKSRDVPKSKDVPKLRDVPKSKDASKSKDAPKSKDVPKSKDTTLPLPIQTVKSSKMEGPPIIKRSIDTHGDLNDLSIETNIENTDSEGEIENTPSDHQKKIIDLGLPVVNLSDSESDMKEISPKLQRIKGLISNDVVDKKSDGSKQDLDGPRIQQLSGRFNSPPKTVQPKNEPTIETLEPETNLTERELNKNTDTNITEIVNLFGLNIGESPVNILSNEDSPNIDIKEKEKDSIDQTPTVFKPNPKFKSNFPKINQTKFNAPKINQIKFNASKINQTNP